MDDETYREFVKVGGMIHYLEERVKALEWRVLGVQEPPFEYAPNPRCRVNNAGGGRCIRPEGHAMPHQLFQEGN